MIRKATANDIRAVAAIYERIHDKEEAGLGCTGWLRGIYPTQATARLALEKGDLFVDETDGIILAAARINQEQCEEYALCPWQYQAPPERVMVLHTLVADPITAPKGTGTAFARFYEQYALSQGCTVLRIDTNERNLPARSLYRKLGYREAGVVPTTFNGIPGVQLVCLEKSLIP